MTLNEYQDKASQTAIYPAVHSITYPALGLAGEAGEVANKVKKILRDGKGWSDELHKQKINDIQDEIGDCLWYLAALARDLGTDLETVGTRNIEKLYARKEKGTLQGDGDKR